jgi:oxygen-dependent protoporphyrinogen oxidase
VGELIDALAASLTGVLRLAAPARRAGPDGVETAAGQLIRADAVVVTAPPHAAGRLVRETAPDVAARLDAFTTTSSGTVTLAYRRDEIDHPLDGYGFVIPRGEPTRIIACTWSSTKLPGRAPDGYALLRVFFGGAGRAADLALMDDELIGLARADLRATMGIEAIPVLERVTRWPDANPQYLVGHRQRMAELRRAQPPWLAVAGCAYDGVGIPDAVRQGREAARAVIEQRVGQSI